MMDIAVAGVALIVLCPLLAAIALLVMVGSGGPIFYVADRVGFRGRVFRLYKFRTMVPDSRDRGPAITVAGDPRITREGRLLRRYKLDELPQLFNVVKGDMSLVGPRPEDPKYVALYDSEQRQALDCRPGLTSLASVCFHREEELLQGPDWEEQYTHSIMPTKLKMEIAYARERSLFTDLSVLLRTALRLIGGNRSTDSGRRGCAH
jgi:lipopolysaccharide/colanic/teichoic acid biosynthesis glycosyltransferase